jgi:hypothetical protein
MPDKTIHPATIAAQALGGTDAATGGVAPPLHVSARSR